MTLQMAAGSRTDPVALSGGALGEASPNFLFPLPYFAAAERDTSLKGRCRRAATQSARLLSEADETLWSLNWLCGTAGKRGDHSDGRTPNSPISLLQREVRTDILDAVKAFTPTDEAPEASLREVLRGTGSDGSCYIADGELPQGALASFRFSKLVLADDLRGAPMASSLLPPAAADRLNDLQRMQRSQENISELDSRLGPITPYTDRVFTQTPRVYYQFCRRLFQLGLAQLTETPLCRVGIFFVAKKNGKLRLILDCRRSNRMCVEAPPVRLLTSEGFGNMEVVPPEGCSLYDCEAPAAAGGISDVDNAFHRLRISSKLGSLFTFPMPVPAGAIGAEGSWYRGKRLERDDMVDICAGALPMGFSWSLYFCQTAMEHQVSRCETWKDMKIMRDNTGNIVLQARRVQGTPRQARVVTDLHDGSRYYVYVDNLGIITSSAEEARKQVGLLVEHMSSMGLVMHETAVSSDELESLGVILDFRSLVSRISSKRGTRIRNALRAVLKRNKCSGDTMRRLIGHCTFAALLRRPSLSCFSSVYKFMDVAGSEKQTLWVAVREELRCFAGLVPLLKSSWMLPWSSRAFCYDSSKEGWGVTSAQLDPVEVAEIGRTREKSRFRLAPSGASARQSAQSADPHTGCRLVAFCESDSPGKERRPPGPLIGSNRKFQNSLAEALDSVGMKLVSESLEVDAGGRGGMVPGSEAAWPAADGGSAWQWVMDPNFREVPRAVVQRHSWRVEGLGRWTRDEAISILEGRALVRAVQVAAEGYSLRNCRLLFLGDNLGVVLGAERSRAHSFALLSCYRRVAAFSLACNLLVRHRWLFSEMNSADEPSRAFSETGSRQSDVAVGHLICVADPSPGADPIPGAKGVFQCRNVESFDIGSDDENHCSQDMKVPGASPSAGDGAKAQAISGSPRCPSSDGSFASAREEESFRIGTPSGASGWSGSSTPHSWKEAQSSEPEEASRNSVSAGGDRAGGGSPCSRHLKRRLRQALNSKRLQRVVLELFAGSAHLTEALKRRGLPALALDLSRGAAEDHLNREFSSVLKGWLTSRVASAVWLGTPCTTWTQALRRPLRTRTRPMGRADLLPHEAAKVRVGNRTFHFSCDVIELCLEMRIPVFLENPAGSLIWKARRLQRLLQQPCCQLLTFDCCQYGSPWRKRTTVAAWGAIWMRRRPGRC